MHMLVKHLCKNCQIKNHQMYSKTATKLLYCTVLCTVSVIVSILCYYRQNKSYIVLHSLSLLDYFPYGAGGIQYLSDSNLIVIAGWSDAKGRY